MDLDACDGLRMPNVMQRVLGMVAVVTLTLSSTIEPHIYIYAIVAKRVRRLVLTYGWIYCSPNICLVVRNNYVACFSYMLILMGKIVRDGFLARV